MMQSLKFKWSVTLVLTSLVGILLVGLLATRIQTSEFQRLRDEERTSGFLSALSEYYAQYGNWDDFGDNFNLIIRRQVDQWEQKPQRLPFAISDVAGNIIVDGDKYQTGERVPPHELDRGKAIVVEEQTVGILLVGGIPEFNGPELDFLERTNRALIIGAIGAIAVALILGFFLSRQFLHPLAELTDAIDNVKQGKFDQRVPVRTRDELGELARTFNQMGEELQRVNKLRRQMTADIAHDLRTPLTVISGYLEGLRDGSLRPTPERFETLYQESQLLKRLIDDLRVLSLADAGELALMVSPVPPRELLAQVHASFSPIADRADVSLLIVAEDDLPLIDIDRDRMAQVLGNLVSNSLRFTPAGGSVTLTAQIKDADHFRFMVSDTGTGIPPEHIENIFARFYRASESRHQNQSESGLGLAIAKSIVTAHHGRIKAESIVGHGTTITVDLPIRQSADAKKSLSTD